jgi:azurin
MGISTSFILADTTGGKFGPFTGQLFVGDQGHSKVMRVFLEKVKGEYQGACFPFREGFASGVLRPAWGKEGSLFVGMTSRGWSSTGTAPYGLQKLTWTGKMPFEIKSMQAKSNGFELEFTMPVNAALAGNPATYSMTGFTYSYHRSYGSPIINQGACQIHHVTVSDDRRKVRLYVGGLREGYIHELKVNGLTASNGTALLHNTAYYTLNNLPEGDDSPDFQMHIASQDITQNLQSCGPDPDKHPTTMPADWTDGPDVVINIGTEPGLKFDIKNFEVEAGSKVQLAFSNNDDMLHNLVVVQPNTADQVGELALKLGIEGPQVGYIPASDNILFHTCLLQPESIESIYFIAPEPGTYTYVCTFPGHAAVMRGTMTVVPSKTASGR